MLKQDNSPPLEYLGLMLTSVSERDQMLSASLIFCIQKSPLSAQHISKSTIQWLSARVISCSLEPAVSTSQLAPSKGLTPRLPAPRPSAGSWTSVFHRPRWVWSFLCLESLSLLPAWLGCIFSLFSPLGQVGGNPSIQCWLPEGSAQAGGTECHFL